MIGRREFGIVGLSAAAALALQANARADDKSHEGHGDMFEECADACADCQIECGSCARHCAMLLGEGKKEHMNTLQTCLDCAEICSAAAQIVARQGSFSTLICESCAEACSRCAAACEKVPSDKHMARCAKECRECETACRAMLKK